MKKAENPDLPISSQTMWRPSPNSAAAAVGSDVGVSAPKPKRQARGRTEAELQDDDTDWRYHISRRHILQVEPCPCRSECSCPSDGRLTYKRDDGYDCSHIVGTMSTYCYAFFKRPLHCMIRQYSCYCRWCARGMYHKCDSLDIVRHNPSKAVRPRDSGYRKWRDEGWRSVLQVAKSSPDPAVTRLINHSVDSALKYVSQLPLGSTVCIMTKKDDGSPTFWLACKQSQVQVVPQHDPDTGIQRGERILPIVWYDRLSQYKYTKLDDISYVSVSSVCVTGSRIVWQRTTTNRYYLGEFTHNTLMELVNNISERV